MQKFDKLKRAKLACEKCGEPLWYDDAGNYTCTCGEHVEKAAMPKALS